jgi:hypothetical protein
LAEAAERDRALGFLPEMSALISIIRPLTDPSTLLPILQQILRLLAELELGRQVIINNNIGG